MLQYIALATLLATAATGLIILGAWLTRSEVRRARTRHGRHRRLPPTLVFGHVVLAGGTVATWTFFLLTGTRLIAAVAVTFLLLTAVLGFTMLLRWYPTYRTAEPFGTGPGAAHRLPPARNLPLRVVITHGCFALAAAALILTAFISTR
ncbi:hypothetical protein ACFVUS_25135 [Nocardia sp. NPDC058058]|uniref:hypothetical protein n=1 Tax=Nocardia sp. NPDC058058 TaxID=3346317 RepID=UPI0036D97D9A